MHSVGRSSPPERGRAEPVWAARSVAVVGASPRPETPGHLAITFLQRFGYAGRIVAVHPSAAEVAGVRAYRSVVAAADQGPIELALIVVPPDAVADALTDCGQAGVRAVIVGTSGFAETGLAGRAAQDRLVALARAYRMRLVGPNCIGAVNLWTGLVASFSPLFAGEQTRLIPGGIAYASASGALGYGTLSLALARGLGVGWAVTTGNEADLTTVEVLAALADAPQCTVALGYLESLTDMVGLRALAATGKPAVLLVAGTSGAGARAAASHTGVLATPERVVDGALRQVGILRATDVDDLLDLGDGLALAAAANRWPSGPRVAVLTTSGGSGILAADAVELNGLRLAELSKSTVDELTAVVPAYGSIANPVDVTATVMRDRSLMGRAVAALAADEGVDVIVACFCVLVGDDVTAIVAALDEVARHSGKPIVVARTGADHLAPDAAAQLRAANLPELRTPGRAVRVAAALWHAASRRPPRTSTPLPRPVAGQLAPDATEAQLKDLLARSGLRVPRGVLITDAADAADAVKDLGGRAVLKVVAPGLVHKTEAGGVVLDVNPTLAADVATRLLALPAASAVLVEEQVPPGVEVLVGVAPSPLGRVLTLGVGGVFTEVLDDAAVRPLPVDEVDVWQMLGETRLLRLLAGVRGAPPANVGALAHVALTLAGLASGWPAEVGVDLNPVSVGPAEAVVLDAAVTAVAVTTAAESSPSI